MPRFYFDAMLHRDALAKGETPWTPAVTTAFQLDEGIKLIEAEGYPQIFARHVACAEATRAGLKALGFRLMADPAFASNTVTSAWLPDGVEWSTFTKACRARNLVIAGGQGNLLGKIFRVGHLGDVNVDDIVRCMEILEEVRVELGPPDREGRRSTGRGTGGRPGVERRLGCRRSNHRARGRPRAGGLTDGGADRGSHPLHHRPEANPGRRASR